MAGALIVNGNALSIPLADGVVQTCVTSPPYYGLRDYGAHGQLGLEQSPEEYVANLVAVFREVWRKLRDDGTLWVVLGDSYWGGKGKSGYELPEEADARHASGSTLQRGNYAPGHRANRPTDGKHDVIKPKDLVGIPWMVAFALRADGWYLRRDIIWAKDNVKPESVKDRPTTAHEYLFLLTKRPHYYYDRVAIFEPLEADTLARSLRAVSGEHKARPNRRKEWDQSQGGGGTGFNGHSGNLDSNGKLLIDLRGRNKRSVWSIPTQPVKLAHFATYPEKLVEPCILAGSKPGDLVLDPFSGSGTTGKVALTHGRNFVGVELSLDYIQQISARRLMVQIGVGL